MNESFHTPTSSTPDVESFKNPSEHPDYPRPITFPSSQIAETEEDLREEDAENEVKEYEEDELEEEVEEEVEAEEEEMDDRVDITPLYDLLGEVKESVAAEAVENRRNSKRVMDALKQFSGVFDALSATVNHIHTTVRTPAVVPPTRSQEMDMALIEMSDRIERIGSAFARRPPAIRTWWPSTKKDVAAWEEDRECLADSFSILSLHLQNLLKRAGLERISCEGKIFDPSCMNAVEAVLDVSVKDHTVLKEILAGWREASSGRLIRSAQVQVSRNR